MNQPDPSPQAVALWLKQLNRDKLHTEGWIEINKRFHSVALAVRPFLREQFPDQNERQAAFDGLTLALMTLAHFEDLESLSNLFNEEWHSQPTADRPAPKTTSERP